MTIKKGFKHWRLNVVVLYYDIKRADLYREILLRMLVDLASIYELDYSISLHSQGLALTDHDNQSKHKAVTDLVYFRSNRGSRVDRKKLRSVIACMFDKSPSPLKDDVEVFPQIYKALTKLPFPKDFYRSLNYPFVEHHKDGRITLLTSSDLLLEVIEKEQVGSQN